MNNADNENKSADAKIEGDNNKICVENNLNSKSLRQISENIELKESNEIELSQSTAETCSNDSQNFLESDHSSSECLESENENVNLNGDIVNDFNILKEQNKKLKAEISNLEKENARLEADRCPELHELQLETLEKTILQQKDEVKRLQELLKRENDKFQKEVAHLKQECDFKVDKLSKQYEISKREKESMVMKYAVSEKAVIDLKRDIQLYENKIKEASKDKEASQAKLKVVNTEKSKINQLLENKNCEIARLERENSKRKDELSMHESKIKWYQNRLKAEVDNHTETQSKLEKLQQKFNEAKEEAEQYKKQSQALIKSYQEAQEDKSNQEKEHKAKLIIDKHDEETTAKLHSELESIKKRQQSLIEENNLFNTKIQNLEKERFEYEDKVAKLLQTIDSQKQVIFDLQSKVVEFDAVSGLLQKEREKLANSQVEIENLRLLNAEISQDTEICKGREAELLEFTQNLTEKNVALQSEYTAVKARAQQLEIDLTSITDQISLLSDENSTLKEELKREKLQRKVEKESLTKDLEEQIKKSEKLAQEVADQQGENNLLKKKHLVTLKELTRELQVSRKKLESHENTQMQNFVEGSRTSSNTSLNIVENVEHRIPSNQSSVSSLPTSSLPTPAEPDRQLLIDKIVKIQKSNARKSEKIEFLEEHVRQLVTELQNKTRIIQNYIIREQSGALSSETMDQNKAALSKHGGIMASVYNSKAVDDGMTLELSLEINKKLQAVLEDTLLKNITLKKNMETLGSEIARLSEKKQPQIET